MTIGHIGPYTIEACIGAGAHARVYRAHDACLQAAVAVKVLDEPRALDTWAHFTDELAALGQLRDHPGVVATHTAGLAAIDDAAQPRTYIAMELCASSLADVMRDGPLSVDHVVHIGVRIAGALAAAHGAEVLHRDVKPSNILLRDPYSPDRPPDVRLADFGIARLQPPGGTRNGPATPEYAAPEIRRGAPASPRSDIYALGVALVAAATGRDPGATPTPADLPDAFPAFVRDVIAACIAADAGDRPASAHVLAEELRSALGTESPAHRTAPASPTPAPATAATRTRAVPAPPQPPGLVPPRARNSPRSASAAKVAAGAVAAAIVVTVGAVVLMTRTNTGPASATSAPADVDTGLEAPRIEHVHALSSGGFAFEWSDPNASDGYVTGFQIMRDGTPDSIELIPFTRGPTGDTVDEEFVTEYPNRAGSTTAVDTQAYEYCVVARLVPVVTDREVAGTEVAVAFPVDSDPVCVAGQRPTEDS